MHKHSNEYRRKIYLHQQAEAFRKIYAKTDKQFVFLIDEWDCVMR